MFYTKYRPQKFTDLEQPNEIAQALMNQIKAKKTVHAYLFTGPRGIGKTTTARILAKALNCENLSSEGDVCATCSNCLAIQNHSFLDLIEIDAASNRGIDDIRDLKDKVKLAPSGGKNKIYIIDEVHMLTNEAFNALLKTLEEPPKHAIFILCTTEYQKVPETIRSRCQIFRFKRAPKKQIVNKLQRIAVEEKVTIELHTLEQIALSSEGGFRDAETLLQQIIESGMNGLSKNTLEDGDALSFATLTLTGASNKILLEHISKVQASGFDLLVWVLDVVKAFRDIMYVKMGFTADYLDVTTETFASMLDLANETDEGLLVRAVELFSDAHVKVKSYPMPQIPVELACLKLSIVDTQSTDAKKPPIEHKPTPSSSSKAGGSESAKESAIPSKEKSSVESEKANNVVEATIVVEASETVKNVAEDREVRERWNEVLQHVESANSSIASLLRLCRLQSLQGNVLLLEVDYKFHKERLETSRNRLLVESAFKQVLGYALVISCLVAQTPVSRSNSESKALSNNLTDMNIRVPSTEEVYAGKNAVDIFDGALPL